MASSTVATPEVETSFEIYENKDFKNHSKRNSGGILALIILFRLNSIPEYGQKSA